MTDLMDRLLEPVLEMIGKLWAKLDLMPVIRWGTVTQTAPLQVRLDGDADPLPFTPQTIIPRISAGKRVLCIEQNRRVIVFAVVAGVPDTGWVTPTLNTNWGAYATETARYQVKNGLVTGAGRVTGSAAAGDTIFTFPPGARHDSPFELVFLVHSDNGALIAVVKSTGELIIASRAGQIRQGVSLASIVYQVAG